MPAAIGRTFDGLAIPASGMTASRTWLNAISDNIANMNTVRATNEPAFQQRYVVFQSRGYGNSTAGEGVDAAAVAWGDPNGNLRYEPDHPLADENGIVKYPDMDLNSQMTDMIVAQRSYQLNISVFERAREGYQRALEIGKQ
jgi:flagellar basal-body rod protein FlgC